MRQRTMEERKCRTVQCQSPMHSSRPRWSSRSCPSWSISGRHAEVQPRTHNRIPQGRRAARGRRRHVRIELWQGATLSLAGGHQRPRRVQIIGRALKRPHDGSSSVVHRCVDADGPQRPRSLEEALAAMLELCRRLRPREAAVRGTVRRYRSVSEASAADRDAYRQGSRPC